MMKLISDKLDLHYIHKPINQGEDAVNSLAQGKIDIVGMIPYDYNYAREKNIDITIPYIKSTNVAVNRKDLSNIGDTPVIAHFLGHTLLDKIIKIFPKASFIYAKDFNDCLKMVQKGQADLTFVNSLEINTLLNSGDFFDLQVNSTISFEQEFSMGISKKLDYRFLNIFNKTIVSLDPDYKGDILLKYSLMADNENISLKAYIHRNPILFSVILGCIFIAIIIFFLSYIYIRQQTLHKIEKIAYTDYDAGNYNINWFKKNAPEIINNFYLEHPDGHLYAVVSQITQTEILRSTFELVLLKKALLKVGAEQKEKNHFILAYVMSSEISLRYALCEASSNTKIVELLSTPEHINGVVNIAGITSKITMNHGICPIPNSVSEDPIDIDSLIGRANLTRIDAVKHNLLVGFYDESLLAHQLLLQKMENLMDKALEKSEFKVYIQPKYDILTRKTVGGEALVRWTSDELGFIRPDEFISLFESNGFIVQLDKYMLRNVCMLQKKRILEGKPIVPISVNQSGVSFAQDNYYKSLEDVAFEFNLPAGAISIELTETVFVNINSKEPRKNLVSLFIKIKKLGFNLSMDDFSKGYSSLSNLVNMPMDEIKIDREILLAAEKSSRTRKMLNTIVIMAHNLNLKVICEGIETEKQESVLIEAGCVLGQGFLYSKPLPSNDFIEFLDKHNLQSL